MNKGITILTPDQKRELEASIAAMTPDQRRLIDAMRRQVYVDLSEVARLAKEKDSASLIGQPADVIRELPGRSKKDMVKPACRRNDGTVRWYFADGTFVFHLKDGHWRLKAIEEPVEEKQSKRKRKRGKK